MLDLARVRYATGVGRISCISRGNAKSARNRHRPPGGMIPTNKETNGEQRCRVKANVRNEGGSRFDAR